MSWFYVGMTAATAVSGAMGAKSNWDAGKAKSKALKGASRDSLLTANYNIRKRRQESMQSQYKVLEQGGRALGEIKQQALEAQGKATAEAGGSGAIVSSGTTRDVLNKMAGDAFQAELDVALEAKNAMSDIARENKNLNEAEWRNAKMQSDAYKAEADATDKATNNKLMQDVIKTGIDTAMMGSKIPTGTFNFGSSTPGAMPGGPPQGSGNTPGAMSGGPPQGHGGNPDPRARGGSRYSLSRNQSAFDANLPSGRNVYDNPLNKSSYKSNFNWASNPGEKSVQGYRTNRGVVRKGNRFGEVLKKYSKGGRSKLASGAKSNYSIFKDTKSKSKDFFRGYRGVGSGRRKSISGAVARFRARGGK